MGVERAVTRWYVQRQAILNEIAQLEAELTQASSLNTGTDLSSVSGESKASIPFDSDMDKAYLNGEGESVQQRLAKAQEKLRLLGPCPKPMMG